MATDTSTSTSDQDETPQVCDICGDESSDPVVECEQCSWNMGECCMYDDICKDCAAENGEREEDDE